METAFRGGFSFSGGRDPCYSRSGDCFDCQISRRGPGPPGDAVSATIDPAVLAFVDRHIRSIEQLEILLLVHRQRDRAWSARAVSDELRSNPDSAAARLAELAEDALVAAVEAAPAAYRYAAIGDADRMVAALAEAYRDFRLRITERVFTKPDGLSSFADAFRLRRKGD